AQQGTPPGDTPPPPSPSPIATPEPTQDADEDPVPTPRSSAEQHETPPGATLDPATVKKSEADQPKKRVKPWVWALVGIGAAVLVAGGVTAGVLLGTRSSGAPTGGTLGLIDGRGGP